MSKRRWSWTEKQKRRTRRVRHNVCGSAPRSFAQYYNRSDRHHNKRTIKNIISGLSDYHQEFRYAHKHSATWAYW